MITRTNRKGRKKRIDLKKIVRKMAYVDPVTLRVDIHPRDGITIRPPEVLMNVFNMTDEQCKKASIVKVGVE
jgi:hypothetical protein